MTDSERKAYISAAKSGNAQAFGELYAEIGTELFRFALWYLKNPQNAEDAVQEACLKAFTGIRSLKKDSSFKAWFMKILVNACKDILSSGGRLQIVGEEDPAYQNAAYYADFSDGTVERYLDRLQETDRRIVLLSVLGDYKSAEIGKLLGMSAAAVRTRLSRALHSLRNQMEADR